MRILLIILLIIILLFLLYLYLIMPRIIGRPDTSLFEKKLFAHRGLHDNRTDAPENSMKAFRKAVDAGYGMELDVQLSADGVPVIMHDYNLQRACGIDRKVSSVPYRELSAMKLFTSEETVPAFRDVLDMVDGRVPLIIELKVESRDTAVCDVVQKMLQSYRGPYCVESFNPLALYWFRKHAPEVVRGQLSDGFIHSPEFARFPGVLFFGALEALLDHVLSRPDFVAYNCKFEANPSRRIVRKLFRLPAAAWTIKSEEELRNMQDRFDVFIFDSFVPCAETAERLRAKI